MACMHRYMCMYIRVRVCVEIGRLLYFLEPPAVLLNYTANLEITCAHCSASTSSGGSVYTRWGKKTCPADTTQIYVGFAAANFYTYTGGGYNFLCMHPTPKYLFTSTTAGGGGLLYQTEYETASTSNIYDSRALYNLEMPCSVCQRPAARSNAIMLPGRTSCPSGFTADYTGSALAYFQEASLALFFYIIIIIFLFFLFIFFLFLFSSMVVSFVFSFFFPLLSGFSWRR